MRLYVCWGTFPTLRPGGHPCANAYNALRDAGHDPELVKVHGLGIGPSFLQVTTDGRREVEALSGQRTVPVLVLDDGEVITESKRIAAWAASHPVGETA
jgi:glutaredoxin